MPNKPTTAQSRQSRVNGARSRGPVTEVGRQRSAANSTKHGLSSPVIVIHQEDQPAFDQLLQSFQRDLQPAGELQLALVHEIACCHWRLRRIWLIETENLNLVSNTVIKNRKDSSALSDTEILVFAVEQHIDTENRLFNGLRRYEREVSNQLARAIRTLTRLKSHVPAPLSGPQSSPQVPAFQPATENSQNEPDHDSPADPATPAAASTKTSHSPDSPVDPPPSVSIAPVSSSARAACITEIALSAEGSPSAA
jgi:hypothetical protein